MIARLLLALIRQYRRANGSRRLLVACNFVPGCSAYAEEAIRRHGTWRGLRLAVGRIRRCNDRNRLHPEPDPVPDRPPGVPSD